MKKELTTPDVWVIVLLFCVAYYALVRVWAVACEHTGWPVNNLWIHLGAVTVAGKYTAWTNNTLRDWWEEWRAKK